MEVMQVINEFTLRQTTLGCPDCKTLFSTATLVSMPEITPETVVEADLHRVLPDAAIRAALVAVCPACHYSWWSNTFKTHFENPALTHYAAWIGHAEKFTHALRTGRKNKLHCLDLAVLALNGCWCAREAGEPHQGWLNLAAQELQAALSDQDWNGDRHYYHYVLAEVCRQLKDFAGAIDNFEKVGTNSRLPQELIARQKVQAVAGDSSPAFLPSHLVKALFCPGSALPSATGER